MQQTGKTDPAPRVLAVVHARMGSSRLPGKAVADLNGMPMIQQLLRRIRAAPGVDEVVLSTADTTENQMLARVAAAAGTGFFAGKEQDLLDRIEQTTRLHEADIIVRVTGDNPLCDPMVLGEMVADFKANPCDFLSNNRPPSYPYGLDLELFSRECLARAWATFPEGEDRETFTLAITRENSGFLYRNLACASDYSRLRWTVDYKEDLEFARMVYGELDRPDAVFQMQDVLALIRKKPELSKLNAMHNQSIGEEKI